ncbi:MAG TPA: S8 family serine peptidase, partial [Actinomycetota bacterium]|nr:S8 family serine peptidase [Actinomycetota bacterium]
SSYWTSSNATDAYTALAGTSMATPQVAGTLADILSENPGDTPTKAVQQLLSSADKSVPCGSACAGLLDMSKALGGPATAAPPGGGSTAQATDPIDALLQALGL